MTIIQSTHIMEEAVKYSNHVVVLNNGEIITQDNSREVFSKEEELYYVNIRRTENYKFRNSRNFKIS